MIKRIYVHNFQCLVNFEVELNRMNLFLGPNGAGKSALYSVLDRMIHFIVREGRVVDLFPLKDVTRWEVASDTQVQHFEFEMEGEEGDTYRYKLDIQHDPIRKLSRVFEESLYLNGQPLFYALEGEAKLYDDDHKKGLNFPIVWNQSGIGFVQERYSNKKLIWFKECLKRVLILQINPAMMQTETREEADFLKRDLSNFASWYRYQSQVNTGGIVPLFQSLSEVLAGFQSMKLKVAGSAKILTVAFKGEGGKIFDIQFDELSDGQKALIALYSVQAFLPDEPTILCIDEPENYLALPEIQPWLDSMEDLSENGGHQLLIISHNPRLIDFLAKDTGLWLERHQGVGPTRVKPISRFKDDSGLPLSDLISRGWLFQEGGGHG